jgi:hypothetical protein
MAVHTGRCAVLAVCFLGMLAGLAGCKPGSIGDKPGGLDVPDDPNNPKPPDCSEVNAGPAPIRRLTGLEWSNSVRAMFNIDFDAGESFPIDQHVDGFDNSALNANISQLRADSMLDAAERVASAATANIQPLLACPRTNVTEACVMEFIRSFGKRAYRRVLNNEELTRLKAVYDNAASISTNIEERFALVIQALLLSPQFNFKVEVGDPILPPPKPGLVALSGYEIASRLAFLLWSSSPDLELLDSAEAGHLATKQGIENETRRMLTDPRAREGIRNFAGQWMELYGLEGTEKDSSIFPEWNDGLLASIRGETERFLDDVIWERRGGLQDLLTSNETVINAELAALYGVPGVSPADGWKKVTLPASQRKGVLTQASFLANHAHGQVTSPVRRGLFVRTRFLCQDLPPPPNDVVITVPVPAPDSTNRQRLAQHSENDACSVCHDRMDPVGFGFEIYDAIGKHQQVEINGLPVDARGELIATRDIDGPFSDALELIDRLARSEEVADCAVKQVFRYSQGRRDALIDSCTLASLQEQFKNKEQNILELLVAMTASDAFRFRPEVVAQ